MLINCPNFNAAPRICDSFATSRLIFASVIITEPVLATSPSDDVVDRRRISEAAPYDIEAAKPASQLQYRKEKKEETFLRTAIMK